MDTSEIELFSIQISQEALEDLKIINKSGTPAVKKKILVKDSIHYWK